jgi:hypothetical protein
LSTLFRREQMTFSRREQAPELPLPYPVVLFA